MLGGHGELHIETKLNWIFNEHNIKISVRQVNVAFKEMVNNFLDNVTTTIWKIHGVDKYFELHLRAEPIDYDEK